jgi:lipopolysaccharide export system protein LptA
LTIERIRTLVLIAGVLLVIALGAFLTVGRWRSPFNRRDLPKKLGVDIQQEANGFTHAEFHAGHALFRITASKVEQLKNSRYRLHSVTIEMYGSDGGGTDRIEGSEFEYDQQAGVAKATGPVEITLDRLPTADAAPGKKPLPHENQATRLKDQQPDRQIHVKTVGLTFNQNSGVATSANHVEFDLPQASGSAMSASYDSQGGKLVLAGSVELNTQRGPDPVKVKAQRAEFDRDAYTCALVAATAAYRHGDARAEQANIRFREDGSAEQLDATRGFVLTTATGGKVAAPTGSMHFDKQSQPISGHLEGGIALDSDQSGRTLHGTAPSADLQFASGLLRRVHMERNVRFDSDEQTDGGGVSFRAHRVWTSPVADLEFREAGKGQVDLDSIHGIGGVEVTSESQRGSAPAARARMTADDMKGLFGENSALSSMTGVGHAMLEQTTETGTRQTSRGDRVEARFNQTRGTGSKLAPKTAATPNSAAQIDSATVIGNVVLTQQAATQPGGAVPPLLRATAQLADYEGAGQLLHLTGSPHVDDGGITLDAEKIDIARASGDALAHGSVKGTWFGSKASGLGAQGPAHVVADEAQLHQATNEATFRGNARLWQQANSVAAPLIVLDRNRQTLVARTTDPANPVKVVLVSTGGVSAAKGAKSGAPSVVRVRGGDLKYSDAERKAVLRGGVLRRVVAETADATTRADEVDLILLPAGNHAGAGSGTGQVDRMTAQGNVSIDSETRRGTGEKLEYSSERAEYVLTGTAANPPRMTDPTRGTVTGESLIFNSRDDSVNVEGGQHATTTETTAPKQP